MEEQEIQWFRARLLEQREQVAAEADAHGTFPELEAGDTGNDLEEQAVRTASDLVEERVSDDRANLLRKIELALDRLDTGTYQQCAHCGKTIPLERLRAKPSASLCLDCQQAKDTGPLAGA